MASAFALVLKKHRQQKGFSQETLAEMADIHPTHVSLIERSERNPTINVAKALDISLADLIREVEILQKSLPKQASKT